MAKKPTPPPVDAPSFAPNDPSDNRKPYEWKSNYPPEAKVQIRIEAAVIVLILFLIPIGMLLVWKGSVALWLDLDQGKASTFNRYSYAWLSGTLGGTLFNIKWLYHVVARGYWHMERRLWRMLTPHLSGGHAFAMIVVMSSGVFRIFDVQELSRPPVVIAVGFLVGYFSDTAIGKLAEIAQTIFGTHQNDRSHVSNKEIESHNGAEN